MLDDTLTDDRFLRGSAVILLAGALWALNGRWGVALVAAVGVLWIALETPTPYIVAGGQLLYAVLLADPGMFGALGIAAFAVLFVPDFGRWGRTTAAFATVALLLTTAALASSLIVDPLWIAALVMCLGFSVAAYSIHRYELIRFGLVEPDR